MISGRIAAIVLLAGGSSALFPLHAQTAPWSGPLRGSWAQRGAAAPGDVTLVGGGAVCQIVVGSDEQANVRQAAEFLAGDIEKIGGRKPGDCECSIWWGPVQIRLVTLGHGEIPAAVNAASLQGQWESYRIVTLGNVVWLVGSNPRGTAFAAYTLSERLGIDPLYIWTGYAPEHRDPLVLKSAAFHADAARDSAIAASSMTTKIFCPDLSMPTVIRCKPAMSRWNGTNGSLKPRCGCE